MYDSIPTILTPEELLDKAFGKASKITKEDPEYFYRVKKTTLAKMESAHDTLIATLQGWTKSFPNLERISTYERELIDLVLGVRTLQRSLSRLEGGAETIDKLGRNALGDARRAREPKELFAIHRRFTGRAASVLEDMRGPLKALAHAREVLQRIPDVTPGDPTIVLGGHPNVGKSSLLAKLTKARPEVAPYPFTTKQINIGHFTWPERGGHRAKRYQVVDTPGLLEKLPEERNAIERQAALAIAYLADLVLYVLDPSEACGYTYDQQQRLLASIRKEFAGIPLVKVATKADLKRVDEEVLMVSAKTGDGIPELRKFIVESLPKDPFEGALGADPFSGTNA